MKCRGLSALGPCQAPVLYSVTQQKAVRYVCGRHLSWQIRRMMTPGHSVTVVGLVMTRGRTHGG